jgi:hypothetical protein
MRGLAIFAAACCALAAEAAQTGLPPRPSEAGAFWMRTYPIPEYGSLWSVDLDVKDGAKAREKIVALAEKSGAALTQPLESFPSDAGFKHQQLSFAVPRAKADAFLRKLRALGETRRLVQKDDAAPALPDEARVKLKALSEERAAGRSLYAQLPVGQAAVDEIIAHLTAAFDAREKSARRVLLNLSLTQSN